MTFERAWHAYRTQNMIAKIERTIHGTEYN